MYENQGSNALKDEVLYEIPQPRTAVQQPKIKKRKRGLTGRQKAAIFMCTISVAALALLFQTLMANLNSNYRILSQKKQELSQLEAQVEQLSSETEGAAVIAATEEQAAELGLYKAGKDQIVYITLDNSDGGKILAEDNSNSGIRAFFNKVAVIAEYFY